MYKQIYIPVDNSDYSNMAIDIGITLAKQMGAKVVLSGTIRAGYDVSPGGLQQPLFHGFHGVPKLRDFGA